jgi:hypothetical protein
MARLVRIARHLVCALRNGEFRWHFAGIKREFRNEAI